MFNKLTFIVIRNNGLENEQTPIYRDLKTATLTPNLALENDANSISGFSEFAGPDFDFVFGSSKSIKLY